MVKTRTNESDILLVKKLSDDFTKIISKEIIDKNGLGWGNNGIGDRFCKKIFNYSLIYANKNKTTKNYSENDEDHICELLLDDFLKKNILSAGNG